MAWVRYDDQFYANPKVTAVIAEDAGALSLHVLANTWTNGQKRIGYIPSHQSGMLVCDKTQGQGWAAVLVRHGLWHEVGKHDCDDCFAEYGDIPPLEGGYLIHNAREYRAPARERQTPGTAADLSEKRREAGRRGGQASAAKRKRTDASTSKQNQANQASEANAGASEAENGGGRIARAGARGTDEDRSSRPAETQQNTQANQANRVSKTSNTSSNSVSPVPGTSPYGEVLPEPDLLFASGEAKVPPSAGTAKPCPDVEATAGTIVAEWLDRCKKRPPGQVIGQIGKHVKAMLAEGIDPDDIRRGVALWMTRNIAASHLPGVVNDVMNGRPSNSRDSPAKGHGDSGPDLPPQNYDDPRV